MDFAVEAYDQTFHDRMIRSWFKCQVGCVDLVSAVNRAIEFVDGQDRYKSVAVWRDDEAVLAFMLEGGPPEVWATDDTWATLTEHQVVPLHCQRRPNIPHRWSPNATNDPRGC